MKLAIKKASTDVTVYLFIQDSSKTTGEGLTGLAYNTASLVASYVRPLAARAALSLATQTVTGAHSDGGFVEVDATNMPGVYRLDLSDAVCATGVNSVVVMLKGAANMAPLLLEIQLTDFDLNDASPNVTVADIANDAITAAGIAADAGAEIADAVWDEAISGHTTAGSFGAKNQKVVPSETIGDYKADVSGLETKLDTVDSNVDAILADTGTDGVKLAADQAVDVTKIGGQAISGNNATLKLKALDIQNSDGNAVNLVSTGSNGNGLRAVGNGNGAGAEFTGGETGMGLYAIGGTTSGHGVYASGRGATSSDGMVAQSTQRRGFSMSGAVQGLLIVDNETESGVKLANNAITAAKIAVDAIGADEIAAGAVTKIQNGLATPTNITAGTITTVTNLTNLPTMPADWITASGLKADAVAEIADGVWDEAISGHTAGTTFGGKNQKVVPSETINDYKADVSGLALEATLTAIKGATWTDETLVGLMTAIEGISAGSGASVADILNALLASYTVSGSVGESLGRLDNIQAKTDLITTGTSLTIASAVVGSTITAHRGDTLSAALENIGALTNNSKVWFTVKRDFDDADSAAVVQIEKTGGLLYINGAAGTTGNGSLTINDVASGDVTIVLNASETAKLSPGNYQYDIQILRSAGTPVSTLTYGEFVVAADVTKATA